MQPLSYGNDREEARHHDQPEVHEHEHVCCGRWSTRRRSGRARWHLPVQTDANLAEVAPEDKLAHAQVIELPSDAPAVERDVAEHEQPAGAGGTQADADRGVLLHDHDQLELLGHEGVQIDHADVVRHVDRKEASGARRVEVGEAELHCGDLNADDLDRALKLAVRVAVKDALALQDGRSR